ncbi:MAG: hypothetical protein MUE85_18335, partial [Microscillaceae bacterium]|nr:hypothetical protein [Microscillaceae bacterium]
GADETVAYFVFNRQALIDLHQKSPGGIRFILAQKRQSITDLAISMLAVGVTYVGSSTMKYNEDWTIPYVECLSSSPNSNFATGNVIRFNDNKDLSEEPKPLLVQEAKIWIKNYDTTRIPQGRESSGILKPLRSVFFETTDEKWLENYLTQPTANFNYVLLHIAAAFDSNNNPTGTHTFIISGATSKNSDKDIVAISAISTITEAGNFVLEWGSACPPDCGQCC